MNADERLREIENKYAESTAASDRRLDALAEEAKDIGEFRMCLGPNHQPDCSHQGYIELGMRLERARLREALLLLYEDKQLSRRDVVETILDLTFEPDPRPGAVG